MTVKKSHTLHAWMQYSDGAEGTERMAWTGRRLGNHPEGPAVKDNASKIMP